MFGFRRKSKTVTLESQLQTLAACGISLLPERTIEDLLLSFPREEYESDPFSLLLFMLGAEVEDEAADGYFSDDLYSFDAESIEDHGDYARKIERIGGVAKSDLPIKRPRDHVDLEAGEAWIEFELDGRTHRFEPRLDNDWFDPAVLTWLARLTAARASPRRLAWINTGDQNILVAFLTPANFKALRKATGMPISWFA